MNMYILFKMFVLCYFCNIDMYIFDKINVLYFTLLVPESFFDQVTLLLLRYYCVTFSICSLHFILRSSTAIRARCQMSNSTRDSIGYSRPI